MLVPIPAHIGERHLKGCDYRVDIISILRIGSCPELSIFHCYMFYLCISPNTLLRYHLLFIYLFLLLFFFLGGGGGGFCVHDDVIKWKHFPRYWTFVQGIHWSPHKGQWRGALMFSLICAWINERVNNREFGDLRRHRAHYNVTVIVYPLRGTQLVTEIWRLTSWIRRLTSCILLRGPS